MIKNKQGIKMDQFQNMVINFIKVLVYFNEHGYLHGNIDLNAFIYMDDILYVHNFERIKEVKRETIPNNPFSQLLEF